MQYATPGAERRHRPAVVTAAAALMMLVAVLGVISTITAFSVMGGIRDALLESIPGEDPQAVDAASTVLTIGLVIGAGFSVLIAAAYGVLSFFLLRGANAARITTWVLAAIFLLCGACALLGQTVNTFAPQGDPQSEEIARAMEEAIPGWYTVSEIAINIVELLALITIIILLALPASNAFFAKPVPQFYPPAEFGGPVQPPGPMPPMPPPSAAAPGGPVPGGPPPGGPVPGWSSPGGPEPGTPPGTPPAPPSETPPGETPPAPPTQGETPPEPPAPAR